MATAHAQQPRHDTDPGGLSLAPFRGLRYSPGRISDPATVLCPPYDVIDADTRERLESTNPHNAIHLILPRDDGTGHGHRYRQAARTLRDWIEGDVLVADPAPALYLYEQRTPSALCRGLIGAIGLREPHEHIVLAHEDVMPGPVGDRLELMRATGANLEPILLAYEGDGDASDVADRIAGSPPLLSTTTPDGATHRLWSTADADDLHRVETDLRCRQALIADGHHRYAAYLRLRQQQRAAGAGPGPWDRGLALLVDTARHPLQLGAIHRVLPGLPAAEALRLAAPYCRIRPVPGPDVTAPDALAALAALEPSGGPAWRRPAFVVADRGQFWLLDDISPALIERTVPHERPPAWRALDATILHAAFIETVWNVPDDRVVYAHDTATVHAAIRSGGCAVLLRPTAQATVRELAAEGVRMPRKSTSFGPKPHSGLVLRVFAAE